MINKLETIVEVKISTYFNKIVNSNAKENKKKRYNQI